MMYFVTYEALSFLEVMQFKQMFVTAVCVLFLLKLKCPESKNFHGTKIEGTELGGIELHRSR